MHQRTIIALVLLALGCGITTAQVPTWSSRVASIIYSKCTPCHRTGEIAPFTLESYQDADDYAPSIKHAVEDRKMPPWPPAKGHGNFMGSRALTDDEIATIIAWVDNGSPEGDPNAAPKPPVFPSGSQLGTPDLVLTMSEEWRQPGDGKDVYRFFVLPTNLLQDRNVAAIEFRPGNTSVVHHVLYFLDTTGTARRLDAADPEPGYAGFGDPGFETAASFLGWVPGAQQRLYPPTIGARLYRNSDLVIQVHYAPSETEQSDRSSVNIFFHDSPSVRLVQEFALNPRNLVPGQSFVIPADATPTFTTRFTIPLDVSMIAVAPHMHLLGTSARAYAVTPAGDTIRLIKIDAWDFHWQGGYAYKHPVRIPRNSTLYYEASYDNTSNNPHNPNTPPKIVTWGEGTEDEMLLCYFHWLPYRSGDEQIDMETSMPTSVTDSDVSTMEAITRVWPNPSQGAVNIMLERPTDGSVSFDIIDASGRRVGHVPPARCDAGLTTHSIDTRTLPAGVYRVRTNGGASASITVLR